MDSHHAAGLRARLNNLFDTLVLAMAVAAPSGSSEVFDQAYADAMVLIFDEYFQRQSMRSKQGTQRDSTPHWTTRRHPRQA